MGNLLGSAAAKMAQRAAINARIGVLRGKVNEANRIKRELNNVNNQVTNSLDSWDQKYSNFRSQEISAVVVTDKFEGESAEKIALKLPEPIEEMENTVASSEGVQGEVEVQIMKLDTYIEKLQDEIATLQAELAAI
ncbi:MAG: hypothetical protein J1F18_03495 [Lachnospiraceae bacterium]|nr:hypothetical protein [Lachnospiraceae bacterium]